MTTLIIFHDSCVDGFTAAWAARQSVLANGGAEPELLAAQYNEGEPPDVTGRDVLIVDFSYPRDVLLQLHETASSLRVIDHHKSARDALADLPFATFDMERSGAGLVWDELVGGPRPWLINYVEDRDLWRWALPDSRAINAGLAARAFDLDEWSALAHEAEQAAVLAEGEAVLRYQAIITQRHVARARTCHFVGYEVPVVNATTMQSEVGNALALSAPFAAMWFETEGGEYVYSLRSRADNPEYVDVSEVARANGGGGHRHAAGFKSAALLHHPARGA